MPASGAIRVKGLNELHRALKTADKHTRLGVRKVEREVAEPVRVEAEQLAAREITNVGNQWEAMRIGITQKLVYVAPKRRRTTGTKRPNLAALLMDKAMQPALDRNREKIEERFENMLDNMANDFNRG